VGPTGPWSYQEITAAVAEHRAVLSRPDSTIAADTALFEAAVPPGLWREIRGAERLYVVGHGALYALPFEALVVGEKDGAPRFWLDEGPPVAYVASGSVLAWLRERRGTAPTGAPRLVAVGDPVFEEKRPVPWPESGLLVLAVSADGEAQRIGVQAGDVIVGYAEGAITDLESLRRAMAARGEQAGAVELRLVREGADVVLEAAPGPLGVEVANEPPPVAGPAFLAGRPRVAMPLEVEYRSTPFLPLPGTRREVDAIRRVAAEHEPGGLEVVTLLGPEATERRLFAAAAGARFLHLATHGIAEETDAASFSAVALTAPPVPAAGDDGYLTLVDLLTSWRDRLRDTETVVLSACETHQGPVRMDEGVTALSWGFHFAGAPTVVASLWAVADRTTPVLMEGFYRGLLSETGGGRLASLHAAKRALRAAHPHPFYWAPFLLLGDPR
jgi:hypothetical protein